MKRIHIVGVSPRSGTTLLAECMRTSFLIDSYGDHEVRLSKARWRPGIYLSKRPSDILNVGPRLKLDSRLSVICMLRDPRDVIVSKHRKFPDQYYVSLDVWKKRYEVVKRLRNHARFMVLRYEDMVSNPDVCQDSILERIPYLQKTANFSSFGGQCNVSNESQLALGEVRPIQSNRIGNWKHHLPRIAGQIERFGSISGVLRDLGYETDDSWLDLLKGQHPDTCHSVTDLYPVPMHKRVRDRFKAYLDALEAMACSTLRLPLG
jgi:hypothetical protein